MIFFSKIHSPIIILVKILNQIIHIWIQSEPRKHLLLLETLEVRLSSFTELGISTEPLLAHDVLRCTSVEGRAPAVMATLARLP